MNFLKSTLIQLGYTRNDGTANVGATTIADTKRSRSSVSFARGTKSAGSVADVQDRYYTREEYKKLSPDQKRSLKLKRARDGETRVGEVRVEEDHPLTNRWRKKRIAAAAAKTANKSNARKSKPHPSILKKRSKSNDTSDSEGSN